MEILLSIGLNDTVFYQLLLFLVTFLVLNFVAFTPFFRAHLERAKRTEGNEVLADEALREAEKIEQEYRQKAKALNDQRLAFYGEIKEGAQKKSEKIIGEAQKKAKEVLENSRSRIAQEADSARDQLMQEIPQVSAEITSTLLGKDMG